MIMTIVQCCYIKRIISVVCCHVYRMAVLLCCAVSSSSFRQSSFPSVVKSGFQIEITITSTAHLKYSKTIFISSQFDITVNCNRYVVRKFSTVIFNVNVQYVQCVLHVYVKFNVVFKKRNQNKIAIREFLLIIH